MKRKIFALLILVFLASGICRAANWTFPESLAVIEAEAFSGIPDMGDVCLPTSVRKIGSKVFAGSTLNILEFSAEIEDIDENALTDAVIGEVTAPLGSYAWEWAVEHGYIELPPSSPVEDFEWASIDDGVSIERYIGNDACVVVPESIEGVPVIRIAPSAFARNSIVETVIIPDGVKRIENRAFMNMTALKSVELPDSVTYIGAYAFTDCTSLTRFRYPVNLTEIGTENNGSLNILGGCTSLKRVAVPEGVSRIPDNTFRYAKSLKEVQLPSTLKTIGARAFDGCISIENMSLPDGLERIENRAFIGMTMLKAAELPDSVTYIGAYAFTDCASLTRFRYPLNLTEIGYENNGSFNILRGCSELKYISIPEGVTRLPSRIFRFAESLEEIDLPQTLKVIESSVFQGCTGIEALDLPDGLERVENSAFNGMTSLKRIDLPDSVTFLGAWAFVDCSNLEYFHYPLHLEEVPNDLNGSQSQFRGCVKLTRIDVPEGVVRIPDLMFMFADSIEEINLPSTLKVIGANAFKGCTGIEALDLPDGLERVENSAFNGMTSLKRIDLPDSVTYLGAWAFVDCSNLEYFHYPLHLEEVRNDLNGNQSQFRGCVKLTQIDVPEGVVRIPDLMFMNADSIEEINLPSTLKVIGTSAFKGCTGIEELPLPEGLERVENSAFNSMTNLKRIDLPDGVTYLGAWTFVNCSSLEYFHYPLHLEEVRNDLNGSQTQFGGCTSLKRIDVPEGVVNIPALIFQFADSLEEVNLPMSLRTVGGNAFKGASSIREVYLNENVYSIGDNAFRDTTLTINCEWGTYALSYAQQNSIPYFYLSRTGEYALNEACWPSGVLYRGDVYIFDGYVRSSVNVSNVKGTIYNSGGAVVRHTDYDPEETDHLLAGQFTNAMDIAGLDLGAYRFVLEGSAGDKYEVLVDNTFEIVPPPLRVRCEALNIPSGFYAEDELIPVQGTVISNYPIVITYGAFNDDGSRTAQVYDGSPMTYTFDLASPGLNMSALQGGGYQFMVTVYGNGESKTVVCSDFTRSGFGLNGTVTSVDKNAIERYVANSDNHDVFYELGVDYRSRLMDALSEEDRFKLGMYTFDDKVQGAVIDMFRSGATSLRSEYLVQLYKKEIASFISSQGSTVDSMSYVIPDHEKIVSELLDTGKVYVEDFLVGADAMQQAEALKLAKQANKSFEAISNLADLADDVETIVDLCNIFADALQDYSQGVQVLKAIAASQVSNAASDYNYQLAIQELMKEYTNKNVRCLDNLVNYAAKRVIEEGGKEAIKYIASAVGSGGLYVVIRLSKIAWDIFTTATDFYDDVGKVVTYHAQIETFYAANLAYQEAFDQILAGNGDESTAIRLVNSYQYAINAAWRSIGTLKTIHYYSQITSDVTLGQIQNKLNKMHCP